MARAHTRGCEFYSKEGRTETADREERERARKTMNERKGTGIAEEQRREGRGLAGKTRATRKAEYILQVESRINEISETRDEIGEKMMLMRLVEVRS